MEKLKKGDKVKEIGTTDPIMKVVGRTVKGGLPYSTTELWTCEWTDSKGTHRKEFKESSLDLLIQNNS